jgi:succinate dehydrogenase/fumarate reductase flavoprotein subunit
VNTTGETADLEVTAIADIVVVGGGPGGCAAALTAAREGAEVLVLEATDRVGGNAARSTGYLAFARSAKQTAEGIEDSPEAYLADMAAEIDRQAQRYGIIFDVELARRYAEESAAGFDFLADLGFEFDRFIPRPKQHSVDRMMGSVDVDQFTSCFARALEAAGVTVRTHVRAQELVVSDGAARGVVVRPRHGVTGDTGDEELGEPFAVMARSGVILAAGGYQANAAIRARYQPAHLADSPYLGVGTDRGDGHVMGQAVGGDLVNMTMIPPLVMVGSALVEDSIAVNSDGVRFHDEAGPYDDRVEALADQPRRLAWYVYDDATHVAKRALVEQMPDEVVTAPSLDDLAAALGVPPEALVATVESWNAMLASDSRSDADFGRVILPAGRRPISQAPFHASRMVQGINFPAGGFRVSRDCQVIDVFGRAVPGLFAVGDCIGGLSPVIGLGGIKITAALTTGCIAGRALATGEVAPVDADAVAGGTPGLPSGSQRLAVVHDL